MTVDLGVWILLGLALVALIYLYHRLEQAHEKLLEVHEARVEDVRDLAGAGPRWEPPEVEKIESPEERGRRAVRDIDKGIVLDTLRKKAQEEGRNVSDSVLEKDAEKIVKRLSLGPKAPNV